jgi:hypothetical protein
MNLKKLQELAKQKGKLLLIESCELSIKPEDITVFEKTELVESSGKPYPARGVLRNVPITTFKENLNGRIYPKDLWEKVIKEGTAENTLSLADHPSDDSEGSIKDIVGVWKNFKLKEESGIADWYLVGDNGSLILEAINAGAKIGLSSVGFGEFGSDNKTVKAESFELQRLADAVLEPSQRTFATGENLIRDIKPTDEKKEIKESMISTNKREIDLNSERKNNMLDKFQESTLKNKVRVAILEAKKNTKIAEAIINLKELKEILPDEMDDSKEKIDKATDELQTKLEAEDQAAQDELEKKDKELTDVKEKLNVATKTLEEINENYKKAQAVVEKMQNISPEDYNQLLENEKLMKEDIDKLLEEKEALKKRITQLRESRNQNNSKAQIVSLVEKLKSKNKRLKIAEEHILQLEDTMENELGYEFDKDEKKDDQIVSEEDEDEDVIVDKEKETDVVAEEDELEVEVPSTDEEEIKEEDEEIEDEEEIKEEDEKDEEDIDVEEMSEELNADDTLDDIIIPKEDKKMEARKKAAIQERKSRIKRQIVSFYKEAVAKNPALKDVKQIILNSNSLLEATEKVFKFKNKKDSLVKVGGKKQIKESARPSWLGNRL